MITQFFTPCQIDEAEDEAEVMQKIRLNNYDVIFLDINIPATNSLELLKHVLILKPRLKIIIFSMNIEKMHAKRYLDAGAMGYLSKDASIDEIIKAINTVLNNRKYYSENLVETLLGQKTETAGSNPFDKLTEREFQIVNLFLTGKSLTEISNLLHIQRSTTGTHKAKIFEKLNVQNMVELVELANMHNVNGK
jgi:two-component system invasion response regulator UvrY